MSKNDSDPKLAWIDINGDGQVNRAGLENFTNDRFCRFNRILPLRINIDGKAVDVRPFDIGRFNQAGKTALIGIFYAIARYGLR